MNLSKTRYCKGIQCPKILWMDKNMPDMFDQSVMDETRLSVGNEVGDLAMGFFGDFTEVPYSKDFAEMTETTKRLLSVGTPVIAEATFACEGSACMVDILRASESGYEIIEVKSSTGSVGDGVEQVKPIYLHDMAYQVYVLTHCGIDITGVYIMQLNRDYVRHGELNIQELFAMTDCTGRVMDMQSDIPANISAIRSAAEQTDEPIIEIGNACNSPYECGYKKWCYRHLPKNTVFDIGWSMWGSKKDDAYNAGIVTFEDILEKGVGLSWKQRRQVETVVNDLPPQIDGGAIRAFLSTVRYPLYHLDFETYQQAIPQWDDVSPYAQIPFQYSLHIQNEPCGETKHVEFLADEGKDPRRPLAERLCADIPMNACVLAYNMSFEKGRIKVLAGLFPDLASHLMNLHENMIDLANPFQSGAYYNREMGGSYSIKSVLPALIPNDPELDYNALNLIQNGSDAMDAFASLHKRTGDEITEIRKALLAYCRLDTLAMVRILEKLYEITEGN